MENKEKRKEYRRKWMSEWRKKNKQKAQEIQLRYWKKKVEREIANEDNSPTDDN